MLKAPTAVTLAMLATGCHRAPKQGAMVEDGGCQFESLWLDTRSGVSRVFGGGFGSGIAVERNRYGFICDPPRQPELNVPAGWAAFRIPLTIAAWEEARSFLHRRADAGCEKCALICSLSIDQTRAVQEGAGGRGVRLGAQPNDGTEPDPSRCWELSPEDDAQLRRALDRACHLDAGRPLLSLGL